MEKLKNILIESSRSTSMGILLFILIYSFRINYLSIRDHNLSYIDYMFAKDQIFFYLGLAFLVCLPPYFISVISDYYQNRQYQKEMKHSKNQ